MDIKEKGIFKLWMPVKWVTVTVNSAQWIKQHPTYYSPKNHLCPSFWMRYPENQSMKSIKDSLCPMLPCQIDQFRYVKNSA